MLTGKQKRYLRGLANTKKAVFQIGKDGLSDNLFSSVDEALKTQELIKLNVLKTCDVSINEIEIEICVNCHCELVQSIGKTLIFYKRAKEPQIILP